MRFTNIDVAGKKNKKKNQNKSMYGHISSTKGLYKYINFHFIISFTV